MQQPCERNLRGRGVVEPDTDPAQAERGRVFVEGGRSRLLDGLRITPTGANSSAVDADLIPSSVLAGVDIVTDGGSSLYGADAVSGVMVQTEKVWEAAGITTLPIAVGFGIRDAATAAAFSAKSLYLPVPTISRERNVRPATLHVSSMACDPSITRLQ